MAIPKLALIPSGVKAGKLYSVLPTNGDGDFTTTRNTVATRVNENGLIEEVAANVPRLDYSDGGCPSLLLEPDSTNIITYSEDFSNTYWVKAGSTITSSIGIDPSGLSNSYTLEATGISQPNISNFYTWSDNTEYALSCFIKPNIGDYAVFGVYGNVIGDSWLRIDLTDNSLSYDGTGFSDGKVDVFENGWIRLSVKYISTSINASRSRFKIGLSTLGSFSSGVIGDKIDIYGAQLEQNSYATSYIKTVGTTQTRSADTANGAGNSTVINSSEGTLYFEGSALDEDSLSRYITISDGIANNNAIRLLYHNSSAVFFQKYVNGARTTNLVTTSIVKTDINRIAIRYNSTDVSVFLNGINILNFADTNIITSNTLNKLNFDIGSSSTPFYGKTKSLQVYTTALSDSELEKLTSYTSFTAMANALNYTII